MRRGRRGLPTTTILVAMVVGVVAVILCSCILLFLDRYRVAMVRSARTSTAQAVGQVSNTVGSYLQDMEQAMSQVERAMGETPERRDELLSAFPHLPPRRGGGHQLRPDGRAAGVLVPGAGSPGRTSSRIFPSTWWPPRRPTGPI